MLNIEQVHKKLSLTERRAKNFIEGNFDDLIAAIDAEKKIYIFKKEKHLTYSNNFYQNYANNIPIYTKKNGFIIPQEQFVKQFVDYSEHLAHFLLSKHNIPIELTYSELIRTHLVSVLDPDYKIELEKTFLFYFEKHPIESKPLMDPFILSIYHKHKEKIKSDSLFFNGLIEDIFNLPLNQKNVKLKTNMFRQISSTPEFAKQFIPKMNESLTYIKNLSDADLEHNYILSKSSIVKEIFKGLECVLGEEGLLKHVRLNNQTDMFYEMFSKCHHASSKQRNRMFSHVIYKLASDAKLTQELTFNDYILLLEKQSVFPIEANSVHSGELLSFKNISFFNEKMNMPLTKLKKYFLLLKKTGELEHIKNDQIFINLEPGFYDTKKITQTFEKVAFLEQFGINPKAELLTNNKINKDFHKTLNIKEDYLIPMMNYLKENKIETTYTTEFFNTFKEKETLNFSKKLAKIDKELKVLMINTDNVFKMKLF